MEVILLLEIQYIALRRRTVVERFECAPMRSAGDVYSLMVGDQLVPKTNQPTKVAN